MAVVQLLPSDVVHVVSCPCADVRVAAAVCGGHSGTDQTDVSRESDQSSPAHIPGWLQILRCRAQVRHNLHKCSRRQTQSGLWTPHRHLVLMSLLYISYISLCVFFCICLHVFLVILSSLDKQTHTTDLTVELTLQWHSFFHSIRNLRQIFQSLPPFIDILLLLLFFMVIFAILGKNTWLLNVYYINAVGSVLTSLEEMLGITFSFAQCLICLLPPSGFCLFSPNTADPVCWDIGLPDIHLFEWCKSPSKLSWLKPSLLSAVLQHSGKQPCQSFCAVDHS